MGVEGGLCLPVETVQCPEFRAAVRELRPFLLSQQFGQNRPLTRSSKMRGTRTAPASIGQCAQKIVPAEGTNDRPGSLVLRPAPGGWKSQPLERHMQTKLLVPTTTLKE